MNENIVTLGSSGMLPTGIEASILDTEGTIEGEELDGCKYVGEGRGEDEVGEERGEVGVINVGLSPFCEFNWLGAEF